MVLRGIDVSYANGSIDWSKVKKSGVQFAILRSTFGSELPSQIDSQFYQNAQGCVRNGVPFGTYHFAYFINEQKAREEADFAIKKASEYKQYIKFIVLDVEEDSERYANSMGYKPDWTACSIAFMERVRESGFIPILYSNYNWLNTKFDFDKMKKYKLWYAAPDANQPKYSCALWQYSWKGKVDGISGDVDMNYLYDNSLFDINTNMVSNKPETDDRTKFIETAQSYIGKDGAYVCKTKLGLDTIYDWCAFAVSAIMKDCDFFGKYTDGVHSFASDEARYGDGRYGTFFLNGSKAPQGGDLIMFRYSSLSPIDKYSASHVGIVEKVNNNIITTLEGNVEGSNSDWAKTSTFKRKTRYLNDSTVYSFFRPNWTANVASAETNNPTVDTLPQETEITEISSSKSVDYSVKVTASDGVNIRSGAGVSKKILGAVPFNTTLKVTNQTGGDGYTWGLITYNNIRGWVALDFTKKIEKTVVFKKGDKVKVKAGAVVYGTNESLSDFVYKTTFQIIEVSGSRIVIGIGGQVTTAIDQKYLSKVD